MYMYMLLEMEWKTKIACNLVIRKANADAKP